MEKGYEQSETGCCPRFNPEPWQDKEASFKGRLFVKDHVRSFFHIPLDFGKVMVRNMERIEKAGALAAEPLMLSDEKSLWGSDIYISVSREVPGAEMTKIDGSFLTRVYEGPYKNMSRWVKDFRGYVASRGNELKKIYFFYTTCPKCAKYYGKNYTVLLAQI
ncbi:MAG: hypothetical protein Q8P44_04305 [Dehalococcoidia bacterium]|nr:hypothetical protein [Dehalococcoidia bacterium]